MSRQSEMKGFYNRLSWQTVWIPTGKVITWHIKNYTDFRYWNVWNV